MGLDVVLRFVIAKLLAQVLRGEIPRFAVAPRIGGSAKRREARDGGLELGRLLEHDRRPARFPHVFLGHVVRVRTIVLTSSFIEKRLVLRNKTYGARWRGELGCWRAIHLLVEGGRVLERRGAYVMCNGAEPLGIVKAIAHLVIVQVPEVPPFLLLGHPTRSGAKL